MKGRKIDLLSQDQHTFILMQIIFSPFINIERLINLFSYFSAIVQRTTVNVGQIKIQALATCLFLCMDSCGLTYGSVSSQVLR